MAVTGFKGFGWILGIATVSPACYMVSSQVAAERSRVETVEYAIVQARRDIRALETEFDTRANLAQLERWNGDVLALAAPRPDQYMTDAAGLATLRPLTEGEQRYAALVVPAASTAPAATSDAPVEATAPVAVAVARDALQTAVTAVRPHDRIQAVAMIDRGILSERTIGDLVSGARTETVALR